MVRFWSPFPCSHFVSPLKCFSSPRDVRRQPEYSNLLRVKYEASLASDSDLWDSEFHRVRPEASRLPLCAVFALVPDWSVRLWSFTDPNPCVGAKICLCPLRGGLLMPLPLFSCLNWTKKKKKAADSKPYGLMNVVQTESRREVRVHLTLG